MRKFAIVAMLIVSILTLCGIMVTQPFPTIEASNPLAVDINRLESHVRHLSVDLYPRSQDRLGNLTLAEKYIESELRSTGAQVFTQDVVKQQAKFQNVIARFGPAKGALLVIGAHYDSHGDESAGADSPNGFTAESHTPGADDNASGVAGLLELAFLLGKNPPSQPVELVAYTLEEPPNFRTQYMGSRVHASSLRKNDRAVRLMLSLEMIGYFSDQSGSQTYPVTGMSLFYPDKGNYIAIVGKFADFSLLRQIKGIMRGATDIPVYSINAPAIIPGVDFSDHLSYWYEGYPALMITDTAFMRNHHYHAAGDTFDKLDYSRMAKVVQDIFAVVQLLNLNSAPP